MKMTESEAKVSLSTGEISGKNVMRKTARLKDLEGLFEDHAAYVDMDPETVVYEVVVHDKGKDDGEGGLLFGTSFIHPGKVGQEYFMTKGHFHERRGYSEYYWGIKGKGLLLLMTEDGEVVAEEVRPGSLHYIPGHTAHRLVNTGSETLTVGACWPSSAGHDYGTILETGFSARVREKDGTNSLDQTE